MYVVLGDTVEGDVSYVYKMQYSYLGIESIIERDADADADDDADDFVVALLRRVRGDGI